MAVAEETIKPELSAASFAERLSATWADMMTKDRNPPSPRQYVYASSWRACDRRLVYDMVAPDQVQPFSPDTLANFRRGQDRERELLIDLARVGRANDPPFEVVGQQERFELSDRKGRIVIVGKTDCRIKFGRTSAPVETKSWNVNTVARIHRFEDLFNNPWTRSGAYQLLCYLYGSNEPMGFMLLDRNGLPLILPVVLYDHLDKVEEFLSRAEIAMDHKKKGTLPGFHKDPGECKRCAFFGTICQPPLKYDGAQVLTDPEILEMLEIRERNKKAAKDFEWCDKELKKRLRGVEMGIAGGFSLAGKYGANTTYDLPPAIKEEFKKVDPKGKFTLTITKVDSPAETE
jgi:hypothetical protein